MRRSCLPLALALGSLHLGGCSTSESATPRTAPRAQDASADSNGACTPSSCKAQQAACGTIPDGCGGTLVCGACTGALVCGGAGPNQCGTEPCTPKSCAEMPGVCGIVSDGCAATVHCPCEADSGTPPAPISVDVLIVGAGSGGVAAALSAARMGASVALVEKTEWTGGQMTSAAVSAMDGPFLPQAKSGLYLEFEERIRAYYADPVRFPPDGKPADTCRWTSNRFAFEPLVGHKTLLQMLGEANVKLLLRRTVASVSRAGHVVTGAVLDDGQVISSHVIVDSTEEGDVLPLTGARYRIGNSQSDSVNPQSCLQSLTYVAVIRRYPGGPPAELLIKQPPPDYDLHRPHFMSIVAQGGNETLPIKYPVSWGFHNSYRGTPDSSNPQDYLGSQYSLISKTTVNWANDYPGDSSLTVAYLENPAKRRTVDCTAKLKTLGFLYYAQKELGQTEWSVDTTETLDTDYNVKQNLCAEIPDALKPIERHLALRPYVRESRRIVAVTTLSGKDIRPDNGVAATHQKSSVAVGDYGTDLHNCTEDANLEGYLGESLADGSDAGRPFQVPMMSLVPETVDGLLAAEKNIGATRLAAGAIRLQPITMLTGQAAGVMSALAAQKSVQPRALRVVDVQRVLLEQGSALSLYAFDDVPVSHPAWKHVQLASTHEVMLGKSQTSFGVADALTRAQAAVVMGRLFALDVSHPPATPTFQDVTQSHPAYAYVEAIAKAGYTSGCSASPKLFCPEDPCTRAHLARFVVHGLGLDPASAPDTPIFEDVPASHPLFDWIQLGAQEGIFQGCSSSPKKFCPADPASRGQSAIVVYNVLVR